MADSMEASISEDPLSLSQVSSAVCHAYNSYCPYVDFRNRMLGTGFQSYTNAPTNTQSTLSVLQQRAFVLANKRGFDSTGVSEDAGLRRPQRIERVIAQAKSYGELLLLLVTSGAEDGSHTKGNVLEREHTFDERERIEKIKRYKQVDTIEIESPSTTCRLSPTHKTTATGTVVASEYNEGVEVTDCLSHTAQRVATADIGLSTASLEGISASYRPSLIADVRVKTTVTRASGTPSKFSVQSGELAYLEIVLKALRLELLSFAATPNELLNCLFEFALDLIRKDLRGRHPVYHTGTPKKTHTSDSSVVSVQRCKVAGSVNLADAAADAQKDIDTQRPAFVCSAAAEPDNKHTLTSATREKRTQASTTANLQSWRGPTQTDQALGADDQQCDNQRLHREDSHTSTSDPPLSECGLVLDFIVAALQDCVVHLSAFSSVEFVLQLLHTLAGDMTEALTDAGDLVSTSALKELHAYARGDAHENLNRPHTTTPPTSLPDKSIIVTRAYSNAIAVIASHREHLLQSALLCVQLSETIMQLPSDVRNLAAKVSKLLEDILRSIDVYRQCTITQSSSIAEANLTADTWMFNRKLVLPSSTKEYVATCIQREIDSPGMHERVAIKICQRLGAINIHSTEQVSANAYSRSEYKVVPFPASNEVGLVLDLYKLIEPIKTRAILRTLRKHGLLSAPDEFSHDTLSNGLQGAGISTGNQVISAISTYTSNALCLFSKCVSLRLAGLFSMIAREQGQYCARFQARLDPNSQKLRHEGDASDTDRHPRRYPSASRCAKQAQTIQHLSDSKKHMRALRNKHERRFAVCLAGDAVQDGCEHGPVVECGGYEQWFDSLDRKKRMLLTTETIELVCECPSTLLPRALGGLALLIAFYAAGERRARTHDTKTDDNTNNVINLHADTTFRTKSTQQTASEHSELDHLCECLIAVFQASSCIWQRNVCCCTCGKAQQDGKAPGQSQCCQPIVDTESSDRESETADHEMRQPEVPKIIPDENINHTRARSALCCCGKLIPLALDRVVHRPWMLMVVLFIGGLEDVLDVLPPCMQSRVWSSLARVYQTLHDN